MRRLSEWLFYLVAAVIAGVILFRYHLSSEDSTIEIPLSDTSMRPAIGVDSTVFKIDASWNARPERMAVVAFVPPGGGAPRVARAVALEADTVEVIKGILHVNGAPVKDTARRIPLGDVPPLCIPKGCVYLMMDAERGGPDSIELGPVPMWRILGAIRI